MASWVQWNFEGPEDVLDKERGVKLKDAETLWGVERAIKFIFVAKRKNRGKKKSGGLEKPVIRKCW